MLDLSSATGLVGVVQPSKAAARATAVGLALSLLAFLASFVISHRHALFTTLFCSQNTS
jgi:hypothetical protein